MRQCPQCQFSNPDVNRFCQNCGVSLEFAVASEPPTSPPEVMPAAAVMPEDRGEMELLAIVESVDHQEPDLEAWAAYFQGQEYVDSDRRYRRVGQVHLRQRSLLIPVVDEGEGADPYLNQALDQLDETFAQGTPSPEVLIDHRLPPMALTYLTLEDDPTIPNLYDAWIGDGPQTPVSLIIVGDRRGLESLSHHCQTTAMAPGEMVTWCQELGELWVKLQGHQGTASLLDLQNLHLNEYGQIYLQQLIHGSVEETPPTLAPLGELWQQLLTLGSNSLPDGLAEMIDGLIQGEYTTMDEVDQSLEELSLILTTEDFEEPEAPEVVPDAQTAVNQDHLDRFVFQDDAEEQPTIVLPKEIRSLEAAGLSDIGRQRDHNEDFLYVRTRIVREEDLVTHHVDARGLYIVCDGMGGHAGGEVASSMAVNSLKKYFDHHWQDQFPDEDTISQGILAANETLYQINIDNERSGSGRMGTTLVMLLVQNNKVAIASVGDSRIYLIDGYGDINQITIDHEVGQREIERGVDPELAYARPDAYQLTQALGPRDQNFVKPFVEIFEVEEDSLFLLCSDGLSDNRFIHSYGPEHIAPLISSTKDLREGAKALINLANEHNGHDNITALLVRLKLKVDAEPRSFF